MSDTEANNGVQVKRGRGRPRKDSSAPAQKTATNGSSTPGKRGRKPGTKKPVTGKRGRGRPKKSDTDTPKPNKNKKLKKAESSEEEEESPNNSSPEEEESEESD